MLRPGNGIPKISAIVGSQPSRNTVNPDCESIGTLAYELWLKRGCPLGSPEKDWLQAERVLSLATVIRHLLPRPRWISVKAQWNQPNNPPVRSGQEISS